MPLADHLRELRSRVGRSVLAIVAGGVLGLVFYQTIFGWLTRPFNEAVVPLAEERGLDAKVIFDGIADPFTVPFKVALFTGLVVAAPVWIYQLWAFVTPGLYRNERRWTTTVLLTSVPLFAAGVALGYAILPVGLNVILNFTPGEVSNYVSFSGYLNFVLRLLLVFGLAFLLPVFVVLLNAVGVLSGDRLGRSARWIIMGIFVFAAVATPTGDPVTMSLLAGPMCLLFALSYAVCKLNDRRRARSGSEPDYGALDDDEASEIEPVADEAHDDVTSALDEEPGVVTDGSGRRTDDVT
ncbi:MAG TPA: twin-arginine translocase subunit TatC [Jiangellales bacterium]|nr:twin-arginine translocase subunit TatC [Jiangellales bacterium]